MKTPMQEHIEWLKNEYKLILRLGGENERLLIEDCIKNAEQLLEKEVMCHRWRYEDFTAKEILKRLQDNL